MTIIYNILIADFNGTSSEEAGLARRGNGVEDDRKVDGASVAKDGAAGEGGAQEDCRRLEQGKHG